MKHEITDWKLKGLWQCWMEEALNPDELTGVTDWIDAAVPGGVHDDLLRAGLIKDPMVDRNSLECEWVENKWWAYRTELVVEEVGDTERYLVFEGIDYQARVVVNGHKAIEFTGMFRTFRVPVTSFLQKGNNIIFVIFRDAPRDEASYGYTAKANIQKSRFGYKWDFCTRLVNIGLYDRVFLHETTLGYIQNRHIVTTRHNGGWQLDVELIFCGAKEGEASLQWTFDGQTGEFPFTVGRGEQKVTFSIDAGSRELWWPNGYGDAKLYLLTVTVTDGVAECDSFSQQVGFRTLSYRRTEGAPEEALPYTAVINGKPVYLKGVNFVPMDLIYGRVTDDQYEQMLSKVRDANINLIRVWGGGMIEKEIFYSLCDRFGIMVWQDFIQSSCGGFSDFTSKDPAYMMLLKQTAEFAVKQKRNHVCLTYWCGGNELTDDRYDGRARVPIGFDDANIAMLRQLVEENDSVRLMLPSTASGPLELLSEDSHGLEHDVHGPWIHLGPQEHYRLLNGATSMLHSEMGTDGMCDLDSIRKFLSPEHIGVHTASDNLVWRHHAVWDTYSYREKIWLGEFTDDELETLITCSQFFQAEGVRYMIEANRRRMFKNTGSIIWQFNEPYPNVSCTNLVDYYGKEKLAYYYVKNSYRSLLPSARYNSLTYMPGNMFVCDIYLTNERESGSYSVKCIALDQNGHKLATECFSGDMIENGSLCCGKFTVDTPEHGNGFTLELIACLNGEETHNSYLFLRNIDMRMDRETIAAYVRNYKDKYEIRD